jgi:RecB family exonuclease
MNKITDEEDTHILKLSASSVKTYEQCPRKYYFNYIEKAPRKHWDHLDLGNLCHKTLETFHRIYMEEGLDNKKTLSKLMSYSFEEARKEYPKMRNNLLSEAKNLLKDYLLMIKSLGMPVVKGVETPFNILITNDIMLRGFLDRLDIMKDSRFRIIDYKTTKNVKYLDEFQLLVYGLWLKQQYPEMKSFRGSYVLLKHGSKLKEFDFNIQDVEKLKKKLLYYAEKIKNEQNWSPIPTVLCNWCDFKEICPAQKQIW